jgi:hypothetical protein
MTKSEFWFSMIPLSSSGGNVPSLVPLNSTVHHYKPLGLAYKKSMIEIDSNYSSRLYDYVYSRIWRVSWYLVLQF